MGAADLRISTFGGLRPYLGQVPVAGFGARSAGAVLAYLACHTHPVTREVLAELVWPERGPDQALTNLRASLHRLRQALGPNLIADRWTVGLLEGVWSDVAEFEGRLRQGRTTEALDLYSGDFLAGFHLADSAAFEDWLADEQERWRQRALSACQEVVNLAVSEGRLDEALHWSQRLVTLDPFHEPGHRGLIRVLARLGRRGAALDHYQAFKAKLAAEMGLEPDPATVKLAQNLHEEPAESDLSDGPPEVKVRRLPSYAVPLAGREAELQRMARMLADPDCRLLTLTGLGGVGKTRLAVEAATAFRSIQGVDNEACFVSLAGLRSAALLFPALARELDPGWPLVDLEKHLFAYLIRRRMIIVLDNFEHLLDGVDRLSTLLREVPSVKVLVTSRERLRISEEWLLPVDGLPPAGAARQLFGDLARRYEPDFDPASHVAAMQTICETVEGLPLALELAASWLGTLSCEQIAARLPDQALMLTGSRSDVPERHLSLRHTIGRSWEMLPPDLADIFLRLSVFRGGLTPQAAEEVAGASLEQLRALVEKSMLRKARGDRFDLHELLRQYAAERLAISGQASETALRHFETYSTLAATGKAQIIGSGIAAALGRLVHEQDNFGAALSWAFSVDLDPDLIAKMVCDLAWYWRVKGPREVSRAWLERVLRLDGLSEAAEAEAKVRLMNVAWMVSDYAAVEQLAPTTMRAFEAMGQAGLGGLGSAQLAVAMTRLSQGRSAEARELVLRGSEHLRDAQDAWNLALAYGLLGRAEAGEGRHEAAQAALAECLARFRDLGNQWGLGLFIGVTAWLNLELGNLELAKRQAEEGIDLLEAIGFRHALGEAYERLAVVTQRLGDEELATEYARRSQDYAREFGWGTASRFSPWGPN